ncbi:MAG: PaaI family thioesterase [Marinicaulis sp.]|nr:PaaI family thioesterase [Marinicaulis sp.]NNE42232.1 PaaI family thioesterase [Marinicaulis sp.]NNL89128.1 PaaI family thioesterase [Marinicaulis sp.]
MAAFDLQSANQRVRDSFAHQGFMKKLGVELRSVGEGTCELALRIDETMTQQHGFAHAGVTTTIADNAAGYAAYSIMPENSTVLTTEFKVNLLAPATGPELVARAQVIKPGRTLVVVRSDVYSIDGDDEAHVLTMLATEMCMMDKPDDKSH